MAELGYVFSFFFFFPHVHIQCNVINSPGVPEAPRMCGSQHTCLREEVMGDKVIVRISNSTGGNLGWSQKVPLSAHFVCYLIITISMSQYGSQHPRQRICLSKSSQFLLLNYLGCIQIILNRKSSVETSCRFRKSHICLSFVYK